jgi:hypothetical protein
MLDEAVAWAGASSASAPEDVMVLFDVWDCEGRNCDATARAEFKAHGIPIASCDEVFSMTLGDAVNASLMPNGGHMLAFFDCPDPPGWITYDDTFECSGFKNVSEDFAFRAAAQACLPVPIPPELMGDAVATLFEPEARESLMSWLACLEAAIDLLNFPSHYSCTNSATRAFAMDRMLAFNQNITSLTPPSDPAYLYTAAGAFAEGWEDVAIGFLRGSSMLQDEQVAGLNKQLAAWVTQGAFKHIPNQLGLNNVCDGGNELLHTMRAVARRTSPPPRM